MPASKCLRMVRARVPKEKGKGQRVGNELNSSRTFFFSFFSSEVLSAGFQIRLLRSLLDLLFLQPFLPSFAGEIWPL